MASKSNNTMLLVGAGAVGILLLANTGALSSVTNSLTTTATGSAAPLDAAGTLQKDIVNGAANRTTEAPNHPELSSPNYQLTPAQCSQYLTNYLDLRQALPGWVGTTEDGVQIPTLNAACQHHWTLYGCVQGYTFFALIPSSARPFQPAPAAPVNNGGGGFWSGLLSVATTVAPLLLAGIDDLSQSTAIAQPPVLGDEEIQILVTGSAFLKGILPFFEQVRPGYVQQVDDKIDHLVNYYLGLS